MNIYIQEIQQISLSNKYTKWYCQIIERAMARATTRTQARKLFNHPEGHHILPKSLKLGGDKDKFNIAYLTGREHFICHWLLPKMLPQFRGKMVCALSKMKCINGLQSRYSTAITARVYESMRVEHSEELRRQRKGVPNPFSESHMANFMAAVKVPMSKASRAAKSLALTGKKKSSTHTVNNSNSHIGKRWINNGVTEMQLPKDATVPVGYVYGRSPTVAAHCKEQFRINNQTKSIICQKNHLLNAETTTIGQRPTGGLLWHGVIS